GLVLTGSVWLDARGVGAIKLEEGDFILLPATPGFTLASDLAIKPTLVTPTHVEELRHGSKSGPPAMRMLGGYFRFDRANAQLLVRFLPSVILIRRSDAGAERLHRLVELIREETIARRPGRELILERLVEVLLIEALRFRPDDAARQEQG